MDNRTLEHLSIVLDSIAFFLVTTDLYGKKRLSILNEKIKQLKATQVHERVIDSPLFIFFHFILTLLGVIILIFIPVILYIIYSSSLYSYINAHHIHIGYTSYSLIVIFLFLTLLILLLKQVEGFIPRFIFFLRDKFAFSIIKILFSLSGIFPVEGIMLSIGTILFIMSKILSYIAIG